MSDLLNDIDVNVNHFDDIYPELSSDTQSHYHDVSSFKSHFTSSTCDFAVISSNIRSLYNKLDEFQTLLFSLECSFDIICITESWLTASTINMSSLNNYRMFNVTRSETRGGGVAVYVRDKYESSVIDMVSHCMDHIESIFVKCIYHNRIIIVGSIYRPPNGDIDSFIETMEELLMKLSRIPHNKLYIGGDFNLNLLNYESDNDCLRFLNLMSSNSLYPLITKPTRICGDSHTLLDNIFTGDPVHYSCGIILSDISDHYPVFSIFNDVFPNDLGRNVSPTVLRYRQINDETLNTLYSSLVDFDFGVILGLNDVNDAFVKFNDEIMKFYNLHCPILNKTVSYKALTKPWIDGEVRDELRRKDNFLKLWRSGRMSDATYKRLRNNLTKMIRTKKKLYYDNRFNEIKGDIKRTWALINSVIKPGTGNKRGFISKLNVHNELITSSIGIADAMNDHFSTVGSRIAASFQSSSDHGEFLQGGYPNSFFLPPVSVLDVQTHIGSLRNKKCSVDTLPALVLKYISDILAPVLCSLINLSIANSTFPDSLKLARVVPLFKGGDSSCLGNYRPISILNIFSKILEKHVYKHLYSYLERANILNDNQFGFRHSRGTTQAILRHVGFIYENLDKSSIVFSLYLDLQKAFDSVDHGILLNKLSFYGIRGVALEWFRSYLSNRRQYVNVNDKNSCLRYLTHSVPQGSNLGPLLFLIFINDLPQCTNFFNYIMFADDCTISCVIPRSELATAHLAINVNLECIQRWLCANKIRINCSKTNYMLYAYTGSQEFHSDITMDNSKISRCSQVKFLGIILDDNLHFGNHVLMISKKVACSLGVLFKLRSFVPETVLVSLYHTLISPYISYAIEAWYSTPKYVSNKINILQKRAVRCIKFLNNYEHTIEHFMNLKVLPLDSLYRFKIAIYMYRTINLVNYDANLLSGLVSFQDQHAYFTRNRSEYPLPLLRLQKSRASVHFVGVKIWNGLPSEVRDSRTIYSFKSKLKNLLMQTTS